MPRFFSLLEAEGLLPEVERLLRSLADLKSEYEEADGGMTTIKQRIAMAGGMTPPREEVALLHNRKGAAARGLKAKVDQLQEMGVQLKDMETGLIDFPTLYRGQEVYLCWKLGEKGIGFWHHVEDGFRGRRPIDKEFLENHRGQD